MSSPKSNSNSRAGVTLLAALLFSVFWATLCNLVAEFLQVLDTPTHLFEYTLSPDGLAPFLLGSGLLWVLLVLVVSVTGRLWTAASLLMVVMVVVGYANHLKLQQRQEPLYPSDLDFALQVRFLDDMVGAPRLVGGVVLTAALAIAIVWVGHRISGRSYPPITRRERPRLWLCLIAGRAVAALACSAILLQAAHFNTPGNPVRASYDKVGTHWAWWLQKVNYERNGFVGGFLYNTHVPAMAEPKGYSAASMAEIATRYAALAEQVNEKRKSDDLSDVNIVIVLSEAFSDPMRVPGATFSQDPIPFTRELMSKTSSGLMLAQLIGGGTANMEFEALTGMSLALFHPQMTSPFQMLIPDYPSFPSAVGYLETLGHRAIAVHPYLTTMYKRDRVYPTFGFERFISESTMRHPNKLENSEFVSDASAFDEVHAQIRGSRQPLFVNLVTMQNHYPTDSAYADPIEVHGLSGERLRLAQGYARGLRYSDDALRTFLRELRQDKEKTAVVFFGDHLPGFWPDDLSERNGIIMRQTPYFLWSNFQPLSQAAPPVVSPSQFLPLLFDDLGAEIPPYYALLDALRREVPAMSQDALFDSSGQQVSAEELSPDAERLLEDYRLVQYDLSVGKRYSMDVMFPQPHDDRD